MCRSCLAKNEERMYRPTQCKSPLGISVRVDAGIFARVSPPIPRRKTRVVMDITQILYSQ